MARISNDTRQGIGTYYKELITIHYFIYTLSSMSNLSYGTNPHYENLGRPALRRSDNDCCTGAVALYTLFLLAAPPVMVIIITKGLYEVVKYPYKKYHRYRLKKIFKRWRKTLSDFDKALIEKYIHGSLRLSTFYKLTPYNSSKCSHLKVMFYVDCHPSDVDVVEHLMAIPPFLLYDDYKVPHSNKIQSRLDNMLKLVKDVYIQKPDHEGFRFLNHNARERYMARMEGGEVGED